MPEYEIELFDEIGFSGMSESEFSQHLKAAGGGDVRLLVNSPGGSVFTGLAQLALLNKYSGHVTAEILGVAASAASYVSLGASRIEIHEAAFFHVHEAQGGVIGNKGDLRKQAEVLEQVDRDIALIYARRTGGTVRDWLEIMAGEAWLTADELHAIGIASAVIPLKSAARPTPETAKAMTSVARRTATLAACINRIKTARPKRYTTRRNAVELRRAQVNTWERDFQREQNQMAIVANASSPAQAKRYLKCS